MAKDAKGKARADVRRAQAEFDRAQDQRDKASSSRRKSFEQAQAAGLTVRDIAQEPASISAGSPRFFAENSQLVEVPTQSC